MFYYLMVILSLFSSFLSAQQLNIVTEHLAPFQIINDNKISGFSTEVVREILDRTTYNHRIKANPWTISYQQAIKSKNTCIYSMAYTEERNKLFQWTGELVRSTTSFYSLKSRNITLKTFEDARKHNIAVIKDDVTHHFLLSKGFIESKNLYVLENYDALLTMLERRKSSIDLVILNDELLKNRLHSLALESKYNKNLRINELDFIFHLACNLNMPKEIINNISSSLSAIKKDGTYERIKDKWKQYFSKDFSF